MYQGHNYPNVPTNSREVVTHLVLTAIVYVAAGLASY